MAPRLRSAALQLRDEQENDGTSGGPTGHEVNSSTNNSVEANSTSGGNITNLKRKRVRGPTKMRNIWGDSDQGRLTVSVNQLGQVVGKQKSTLVHFLGTIARNGNYAPLNYKSWRRVPELYKENMMRLIKLKFDIPPGSELWIKKSLAKKWRSWKTMLKEHFNPDLSVEAQLHNVPPRVKPDQWEGLLKIWNEEDMKKLSEKNKASRAMQKMIPKTGKKSFAEIAEDLAKELGRPPTRMELFAVCFLRNQSDGTETRTEAAKEAMEKMRQLAKQAPEGFDDSTSKGDVFSQVMGEDRNGHVRMYGLGVAPSDLWGDIPSRSTSYRMAMEYKTQLDKVVEEVQELRSLVLRRDQVNNESSAVTENERPIQPRVTSPLATRNQTIRVGSHVALKSISNPLEIVAKGVVNAMDPFTRVGGVDLGKNWCEVLVQVAVKWEEELIRPYDLLEIVGDALGAPIAWPLSLVMLDKDSDI